MIYTVGCYGRKGCCRCGESGRYISIQGPQGERGEKGEKGDKGDPGEQGIQGIQGLKGDTGERGEKGEKGEKGDKGERGEKGEKGDKGDPGEQGIQGIQGLKGDAGERGEKGDSGETPAVTVAESTPISYRLNFKTTEQDITTPNLYAPFSEYHADISATNSTLSVPIKNLTLTYQATSSSALTISIAPADAAVPILTDIRRTTICNNGTAEAQSFDNTTVSARTVLDEIVYTKSQETHSMKIRQQDPTTKLWYLCEVDSFISYGGARTSVRIEWSEYGVSYSAPTNT